MRIQGVLRGAQRGLGGGDGPAGVEVQAAEVGVAVPAAELWGRGGGDGGGGGEGVAGQGVGVRRTLQQGVAEDQRFGDGIWRLQTAVPRDTPWYAIGGVQKWVTVAAAGNGLIKKEPHRLPSNCHRFPSPTAVGYQSAAPGSVYHPAGYRFSFAAKPSCSSA